MCEGVIRVHSLLLSTGVTEGYYKEFKLSYSRTDT